MLPAPPGVRAPPSAPYAHVQPRYAQQAASYASKGDRARGKAGGAGQATKAGGGKGSKGGKADRFAESKKNAAMITAMANRWM